MELIAAMYVADIGLTGAFAMFWFHGLLVGKTWHPPMMVRRPDAVGGFVDVGSAAGFGVGPRGGSRGRIVLAPTPTAVGGPGRCGSAPREPAPATGSGTACPEGPLQAVTTTSEHTSAVPSRRPGVLLEAGSRP